jgi:undecaprenyl pyrophosphate synthase
MRRQSSVIDDSTSNLSSRLNEASVEVVNKKAANKKTQDVKTNKAVNFESKAEVAKSHRKKTNSVQRESGENPIDK